MGRHMVLVRFAYCALYFAVCRAVIRDEPRPEYVEAKYPAERLVVVFGTSVYLSCVCAPTAHHSINYTVFLPAGHTLPRPNSGVANFAMVMLFQDLFS
jgi:hypothetical protein